MPSEAELLDRRFLLKQQLALLDTRCGQTSSLLAVKRLAASQRSLAPLADTASSSGRPRVQPTTFHRMEPPSSLVLAQTHAHGTAADRMRSRELMKRSARTAVELGPAKAHVSKGPSSAGAYRKQHVVATMFPTFYKRGELPCIIEHRASGNGLSWICPLLQLDYAHYLPIFFDGIRCAEDPYRFVARQGCKELVDAARGYPDCILPVLPDLIMPLRLALTTKDPGVVHAALLLIQDLVMSNFGVGEALVPYYKQLLNTLNLFFTKRQNIGDAIFYGQRKGTDIGTAVLETLEVLEKTGGPQAFAHIKIMVPAYESCCQ